MKILIDDRELIVNRCLDKKYGVFFNITENGKEISQGKDLMAIGGIITMIMFNCNELFVKTDKENK